MRHRRASRLVLLVMPFLLIVAARTAAVRAQQGPVITSRAYTIFGEKKYPASPTTPCSLDTARLTGVIQVDTRVTSEAGTYKAEIYSNLIDVTGTGDVSGLPYRAHGPSQMDYSWAGPGGASVPFMGTYEFFRLALARPPDLTRSAPSKLTPMAPRTQTRRSVPSHSTRTNLIARRAQQAVFLV